MRVDMVVDVKRRSRVVYSRERVLVKRKRGRVKEDRARSPRLKGSRGRWGVGGREEREDGGESRIVKRQGVVSDVSGGRKPGREDSSVLMSWLGC